MSHWQYQDYAEPLFTGRSALPAYVPPLEADPPRARTVVALAVAACFFVPAPAPAATPYGWQQPLSEPIRVAAFVPPDISPFVRHTPAVVTLAWMPPLSEPVRVAPFRPPDIWTYFQGIANTAVPSFGWYEPLSEPVWTRQPLTHSPASMFVQIPPPATAVPFGWFVRMPDLVWGKTLPVAAMPFFVSDPRWLPPTPPPPTYTTETVLIRRLRRSPHVSQEDRWIFYRTFQLDMDTGIGVDGGGQGSDPMVMLRWSDDDGETWSNEHWVSAGRIGEYDARAEWRRLGRGRDRVFEVVVSDPVAWNFVAAYLGIDEGTS